MKLGLEYIISVTSSSIIPYEWAKVSVDFYKSVKSAKGSCNIPKNFQIRNLRQCQSKLRLPNAKLPIRLKAES
jgi:hypothetical protein